MRLQIVLDGVTYISQPIDQIGFVDAAESLFKDMGVTHCYQMFLEDGILVLGKDAVQKAHFIFRSESYFSKEKKDG